jgi:hypothetical protein
MHAVTWTLMDARRDVLMMDARRDVLMLCLQHMLPQETVHDLLKTRIVEDYWSPKTAPPDAAALNTS